MKHVFINPNGQVAIRVSIVALMVGGAWVALLFWGGNVTYDPPDVLRLVPVAWLFASFAGLMLGFQSTLANVHRWLGLLSVLICALNIPFAAIFALAAMMGD